MKVHSESDRSDAAIERIISAVKKYAPSDVEFTSSEDEADLVILYVYGFRRYTKYHISHIKGVGKKCAIVQLCVRSTPNPSTTDWIPLWEQAELVWSYYDLQRLCLEDSNSPNFNFYHAPLGADEAFIKASTLPHSEKFLIASTGSGSRFSLECKNEVISAADGKPVFQLGTGENTDNITFSNGMDDETLANYYSQCKFVSGLHRIEGFELPALEGLLCGSRPICFDTINYRYWFDGLAEFIPEDKNTAENLRKVFAKDVKPVSDQEKEYVKTHFDWQMLAEGFWEKLKI